MIGSSLRECPAAWYVAHLGVACDTDSGRMSIIGFWHIDRVQPSFPLLHLTECQI